MLYPQGCIVVIRCEDRAKLPVEISSYPKSPEGVHDAELRFRRLVVEHQKSIGIKEKTATEVSLKSLRLGIYESGAGYVAIMHGAEAHLDRKHKS